MKYETRFQRMIRYTKTSTKDDYLDHEERHRTVDEEKINLIEDKYRVKKGYFHLSEKKRNGYDTE